MSDAKQHEVTMKGNPVTLAGPRLSAGDKAPDFQCVGGDLGAITLADTGSKIRLFSVVPSLDTPVCSIQTKTFADRLNALGDAVAAYTVSLDLPFAMKRFCADSHINNIVNLSDVANHSFGEHYGVLIKSLPIPLLCRAVFVVDGSNTIRYVEYVSEITNEPNFDAALSAIQALVKG
jgi:thiol peroxidase